ncbi:MAG: hypothetical protein RML40_01220 [Bacteroidota bacterium]|nr:hypothetical protein [Candidatus Kapabacteria bacterium]MDW8219129.1 hypothetical protein [Bacteroidota bacterium]
MGNIPTGSFYPYTGAFPSFPVGDLGDGINAHAECKVDWWEDNAFVGKDMFDDFLGMHPLSATYYVVHMLTASCGARW